VEKQKINKKKIGKTKGTNVEFSTTIFTSYLSREPQGFGKTTG
jgi:hypothetical protein